MGGFFVFFLLLPFFFFFFWGEGRTDVCVCGVCVCGTLTVKDTCFVKEKGEGRTSFVRERLRRGGGAGGGGRVGKERAKEKELVLGF